MPLLLTIIITVGAVKLIQKAAAAAVTFSRLMCPTLSFKNTASQIYIKFAP